LSVGRRPKQPPAHAATGYPAPSAPRRSEVSPDARGDRAPRRGGVCGDRTTDPPSWPPPRCPDGPSTRPPTSDRASEPAVSAAVATFGGSASPFKGRSRRGG